MLIIVILSISTVLQVLAAIIALRLIPLTRKTGAWYFISGSLFLMAIRRMIPLYQYVINHNAINVHFLNESVGLVISAGMLAGVMGIRKLFINYNKSIQALMESEQKFAIAFQSSPLVIAINSLLDGRYVDVNDTFVSKTGFSRSDVIGKTSAELGIFQNYGDRERLIDDVKSSINVYAREIEFVSKDGEFMHGLLSAGVVHLEGRPYLLSTIVDITDHKNIEREKFRMLSIVEKSLNEIYIINAKSLLFEYANQGALKNIGFELNELKQITPIDLKPFFTIQTYKALVEPLVNGEEEYIVFETLHQRKDRTHYYAEVHMQIYRNAREPVFFAIVNDITQRKKAQEELKLAKEKAEESDRLKTAFLHNISHEIRTPMNAIIGFSGLLKNPALTSEKRTYFTNIVIQSTNQLLAIITDIINIATIEAGQEKINLSCININHNIDFIVEQFAARIKETDSALLCNKPLADEKALLLTDETKLLQVLTNLLNNALKFARGGKIEVGYQMQPDVIEFYVADNGPGIPVKMHDEIFKRFRQLENTEERSFGGSGLGLSISKAYVELLGGQIWVESSEGKGARFIFTIPFIHPEPTGIITDEKITTINIASNLNILIADDEEANVILLKEMLAGTKSAITHAKNGAEAVSLFKSGNRFDLVLMDMKMPEVDGYEATRLIKLLNPKIPVIAQTAYADNSEQQRALNAGCDDIVSKPISQQVLLDKIKHLLAAS